MRGKAVERNLYRQPFGITPAYAGKSSAVLRLQVLIIGSPPPMRGKAVIEFESSEFNRITPAYAGKRVLKGQFPHL